MWHHYSNDTGDDGWKPKGDELYDGFSIDFITPPNSNEGYSAYWYTIIMDEGYACCFKECFSSRQDKINQEDAKELIRNGHFKLGIDYDILFRYTNN